MILWNLETGEPIRRFQGHKGAVLSAAFTPDGLHAVSVSMDATARLWDLDGAGEIRRLSVPGFDQMEGLAISPDGHTVLAGVSTSTGDRSAMILWDLDTYAEIRRYEGHTGAIRDLSVSPDGKQVLTVSSDDSIRLWDLESGVELRRHAFTEPISVAFTPDGRSALVESFMGSVFLVDVETGELLHRYGPGGAGLYIENTFSEGHTVLTVVNGSDLSLWDIDTEQGIGILTGHKSITHAVAVSADSRLALSGGTDPYMILWDLETCSEIRRLLMPTSAVVKSLAFSPDGGLALSGQSDGVVILWDVATGELLARYDGHYGEIAQVRFSPGGKTFFSTALDGTLREWTLPPRSAEDWLNWSLANRYVRELVSAERQFYRLSGSESRSNRDRTTGKLP